MQKRYLIIIIVLLVIIIGGSIALNKGGQKPTYDFIVVKKQNLVQEVSVTGKVRPAENVQLTFEKGGRVIHIFKQIGDPVKIGDPLVELENYDLKAQLAQAQAAADLQSANLAELKKGTRIEELQVAQTKVDNAQKNLETVKFKAQTDLANLYDDVKDTLNEAFIKADDAVNKQTAELFTDPTTNNPKIRFAVSNVQIKNDTEWQRVLARNTLQTFQTELANLSPTNYQQLDDELVKADGYLDIIKDYLNKTNDSLIFSLGVEQTTLTAYQGYVNTSRTNVNTVAASVNSQKQSIAAQKATNQQNIDTAQSTLDSAQKELILKQAPATPEQLSAQEAQLQQAQANVENIRAQIAKSILRSPINGVVAKMEAKLGEVANAQSLVAEVISQAKFQVEVNIPEADIAKVEVNNPAKITLDAYGSDVIFEATVVKIEPSATIVEGIPTYKTTLQFKDDSDKIKSGMTANLDILTANKENVIAVPYRAVIDQNGEKFVKILKDKNVVEERAVSIGLRGSDGNIEILEGLSEGEKVITFDRSK
ncbi:MAG: efflux RND transporter periplasmic adaptor subunit [Candidatus Pacebacteria bacterium]|nr:efflux RND transporter periplasmic adaptor subunit [Candidatus Paceibacterota bacterium]